MRAVLVAMTLLPLLGCDQKQAGPPPGPAALPPDAVAYYCAMAVADHTGPKAQIWLMSKDQPLWFTQVRDAVAFTLLPEEPKDIRAIWVNDMAKSASWDHPDAWVLADKARFVVGSDAKGGMGLPEVVPFSDPQAATAYAAQHGGRVVAFKDIPGDQILADPVPMPHSSTIPSAGGRHGSH